MTGGIDDFTPAKVRLMSSLALREEGESDMIISFTIETLLSAPW
jgi:hypothetical protein